MITIARMVKSVANSAGMKPRFERMIFVAELSISSGLFMKGSPMSSLVRNSRWIPLLLVSSAAACVPQASDAPSAAAEAAPVAPVASAIESLAEVRADAEALVIDEAVRHGRGLTFAPCADDPELECGQLQVPVDYARPRGQRLQLATVRAPATGPRRQGMIFVNPGGPGASGVDFVTFAKPLFAALRESFDIVSFDPRGTARSSPVDCDVALPAPPLSDTLDATAAYLDEVGRRYAAACGAQYAGLATAVGTNNVARDMDVFREALGEREFNYLGYSYGTILGASYATLFPGRVRAMVLDGNAPPAWFADYLVELDAEGSAGAEAALRRIDQLCRAAADCPLRTEGVVTVFDRVVERLNRNPVPAEGGVISGLSVTYQVFGAMYNEPFGWPYITRLLARVDGGDTRGLPAFPQEDGPSAVFPGTFAILCSDATTRRGGLDYLPSQNAANATYSRFGGINFGIAPALCSAWPRPPVAPLTSLRTRGSIVLIGNDFDPATPMTWSRNMAAALGPKARLVRYQGGGHTIYGSGSACVDGAVEGYFRRLTSPALGLTCPALPLAFSATARLASTPRMSEIVQQVTPKAPVLPGRR